MDLSLVGLLTMVRDTLADPRAAARRIMALDLSLQERWLALLLMAVVLSLLTQFYLAMAPADTPQYMLDMMSSPLRVALFQTVWLFSGAVAIHRFGRAWGGTGTLGDAVSLVAWLQFIMIVAQIGTVILELILPPVAPLVELAVIGIYFWLLTHFVAEMHGFRSLGGTFFCILLGMVALLFLMVIVLYPFMPDLPRT